MRRSLIFVLAVACGLTVANLYYSQPLLDLIADAFDVSQGAATVVVTVTQIGYAVGLLFLLPLGDLIENRKLTTRLLIGTAAALLLAAVSPAYTVFLLVSVLIGVTSVVAQILVPFAAHLAPEEQRGALVGKVMGGLLLGILLARTVSSFVADLFGWRAIYFVSAALMVGLAVVLRRMLPSRQPEHAAGYGSLLRTVWGLVRTEPVLRRRALCQGLVFGAFSAFWTAIAYELIGEHGLGQAQIAIFALVGAGGATAAPLAGKLADRGYGGIGSGEPCCWPG
ncbi:MFS transporter [Paractinoplanes durhamensis]|uniref:MFS transporter n=1 Tax=Paractinoplanes durhamensis TaxID=113563 RepID=UPI0036454792